MSTTRPPTVLAVDDSPVMQKTIQKILGHTYRVLSVDNALDALNTIYNENISVMLLDVSMPDIDGLEVCRTIRSLPQFVGLPIIMVTARDKAFDRVQGKMAGATEYLTKPFSPETLLEIVERYV
ncbi:MAG: response regulator [Coleofasciculaceae cyanobacterium RL_1_1]|jgi:DNA-binding response OmpR family regulator|nr:response regulator [Coleofasciculaceae cyanobacterium RL_1_1]